MIKFSAGLIIVLLVAFASYFYGTTQGSRTIEAPPAQWAEGNEAAQSWRKLMVSLEAAGARVFAFTEDPLERASGLEYLAQLASASLEMKLAKGDPAAPEFTDWMGSYRKFLGDSPDAVYKTAEINADYQYEIVGNVGDVGYLGVMLYGKSLNGWNRAAANLSLSGMTVSESGDFRLLLSSARPAGYEGDWLELENDIHLVMVRQYFHDRANSREASFTISTLDPAPYRPVTEAMVARRLDDAAAFFNETLAGNIALMEMISGYPNSFDTPKEYNAEFGGIFYPTLDNLYYGTWYVLADGEALVIEGEAPKVDYWSISLQNIWMQTHDYAHHQVTLNNRDIRIAADGRYRIVVSAQNPGVDNWVSTAGSNHGLLSIRYQLATEGAPPTVRLAQLDEL